MTYHITCSTDDKYVQHCMAMLCSLFENNKEKTFCVHIIHDGLTTDSKDKIQQLCLKYKNDVRYYTVDSKRFQNVKLNGNPMYSMATYYRFMLPEFIDKSIDQILYLDCDVIVLGDVYKLYHLNMSDMGVAAVADASPYDSYHRWKMGLALTDMAFCAGVMMINLKYWRDNDIEAKLFEYATRPWEHVYMQDQDALNYVFRGNWFVLPFKWAKTPLSVAAIGCNQKRFDYNEYVEDPVIYHYSSPMKPWLDVWFPDRYYYWKYASISGFKDLKVNKTSFSYKLSIAKNVLRFYINKYIHPLIPEIIEIILVDIFNIVMVLISITSKSKFRNHLTKMWVHKYLR